MVWVSNQSGTCLNVSITARSGGSAAVFPVEHALEAWGINHWQRAANASETAVIRLGGTSVTVNDVKGTDFILVYKDGIITIPDTNQVYFS
ncbi:hypothetical protein CCMSSC00406_0009583 [Pleurotus cornucopiae]|uniref:Uncharacterized protein n=1 Tax=Pleurotus cornucopiae TaxID=5321 RepID=A0ACB7IV46_PLECO|nr:hypothetical protein CCMSSC00406_0009583 [Pleurotus cornucopiae]